MTLSTGETVSLASLYESRRLVLVFLRHFGCIFCQEHVAALKALADTNLVFVTLGNQEQAEEFRLKTQSPHRFIADPERKLHALFDLPRGGLAQMIAPHVMIRGLAGIMKGYVNRRGPGDPMQLPGVFIIETDGSVIWEYRGRDASDNPPPEEIQRRLKS